MLRIIEDTRKDMYITILAYNFNNGVTAVTLGSERTNRTSRNL